MLIGFAGWQDFWEASFPIDLLILAQKEFKIRWQKLMEEATIL
jgi:hypothetical protein